MKHASRLARIVNTISCRTDADNRRSFSVFHGLRGRIPGWSQLLHLAFFECVARELPAGASALVCGVYHGLDLACLSYASELHGRNLAIYGVDLFDAGPCADWTPEQREKGSWQANGFGSPPDIEIAAANAPRAVVIRSDSVSFMETTEAKYDFIYLDTSHDEATVAREIEAARRVLAPGGILAGDDYCEAGSGWGVDAAVAAALPNHLVLCNRIWLST